MAYTTSADVSAELGGITIDASSTPTSTTVNEWISQADDEIDARTGRVWASTAITSTDFEYFDYDGGGIIRLGNKPIISVQSVEYDSAGLGNTSNWVTISEGRGADKSFILYKEEGLLDLHGNSTGLTPPAGQQNIRIAYTHGYGTTPARIKRLSTLMAAQRYILSVSNKTGSEEGGSVSVGTISVSDPNNYVHEQLTSVNKEIDIIFKEYANDFKPIIYDNRVYD